MILSTIDHWITFKNSWFVPICLLKIPAVWCQIISEINISVKISKEIIIRKNYFLLMTLKETMDTLFLLTSSGYLSAAVKHKCYTVISWHLTSVYRWSRAADRKEELIHTQCLTDSYCRWRDCSRLWQM